MLLIQLASGNMEGPGNSSWDEHEGRVLFPWRASRWMYEARVDDWVAQKRCETKLEYFNISKIFMRFFTILSYKLRRDPATNKQWNKQEMKYIYYFYVYIRSKSAKVPFIHSLGVSLATNTHGCVFLIEFEIPFRLPEFTFCSAEANGISGFDKGAACECVNEFMNFSLRRRDWGRGWRKTRHEEWYRNHHHHSENIIIYLFVFRLQHWYADPDT